MQGLLRWVVGVAACGVLAAGANAEGVSQRWGILIGVDDYANASDLEYCGADQRELYARLKACGVPEDHLFLLHDQADDAKYRPSKGNIERQLDVVVNLAEADDLLVVTFSGHGVAYDGKSYLCPSDATLDDPATLVSLDAIYDRLNRCAAKFKLIVVDACRDDPRPGKSRSLAATDGTKELAKNLQQIVLPQGVVLLNSCAPGEISWEEEKFGHGVYMHYILEALTGLADDDGDGSLSLAELQNYTGTKTKTYVARRFSHTQRPFVKSEGEAGLMQFALLPLPAPGADKSLVNGLGMKLALIPAGEFMMGSTAADPGHEADEHAHRAQITKPFYMGTTEVTRGQFAAFVTAENYQTSTDNGARGEGYNAAKNYIEFGKRYSWRNTGYAQTDDHPVVNVSFHDAQAFCDWLSKREGRTYRLPTEAEWEYACRAGTDTPYFHGDDGEGLVAVANVADASAEAQFPGDEEPTIRGNDGHVFTAPVASFKPNAFGLYDMSGNVWEWCADWYDETYYQSSRVEDPAGYTTGTDRVGRGGSWSNGATMARSAYRNYAPEDYLDCAVGFRVVASAE